MSNIFQLKKKEDERVERVVSLMPDEKSFKKRKRKTTPFSSCIAVIVLVTLCI